MPFLLAAAAANGDWNGSPRESADPRPMQIAALAQKKLNSSESIGGGGVRASVRHTKRSLDDAVARVGGARRRNFCQAFTCIDPTHRGMLRKNQKAVRVIWLLNRSDNRHIFDLRRRVAGASSQTAIRFLTHAGRPDGDGSKQTLPTRRPASGFLLKSNAVHQAHRFSGIEPEREILILGPFLHAEC
jgi:hypothetical protein